MISSVQSSSPIQRGIILYCRLSSFICVEYIIQDMCFGFGCYGTYCHGGSSSTEPTSMIGNRSAMIYTSWAHPTIGFQNSRKSTHPIPIIWYGLLKGWYWVLTTYEWGEWYCGSSSRIYTRDRPRIICRLGTIRKITADPRAEDVGGIVNLDSW